MASARPAIRATSRFHMPGGRLELPRPCGQRILKCFAVNRNYLILLAIPPSRRSYCVRLCVSFGQAVGVVDAFCWPKDCATVHGGTNAENRASRGSAPQRRKLATEISAARPQF